MVSCRGLSALSTSHPKDELSPPDEVKVHSDGVLRPYDISRWAAYISNTVLLLGLVDDALANRVKDELRHGVQIELSQDMRTVGIYRVKTQIEHIRDFLVAFTFGHQLQDLALAAGQQLEAVLFLFVGQFAHVVFLQKAADFRAE